MAVMPAARMTKPEIRSHALRSVLAVVPVSTTCPVAPSSSHRSEPGAERNAREPASVSRVLARGDLDEPRRWCAIQNKTANSYTIEITI